MNILGELCVLALGEQLVGKQWKYGSAGCNVLVVNFKLGQLHPSTCSALHHPALVAVIATLTQAGALPESHIHKLRDPKK